MKSITVFILISLFVFVTCIFPQQKFRKAVCLHRSVGYHIYSYGVTTNVPNEINNYNVAHNYTGTDAVSMDEVSFPSSSNCLWNWLAEFNNTSSGLYTNYLNTTTYDVVILKECFASQSNIWGYGVPADTGTHEQTILNYKWHCRKILRKMAQHPDKFFVWWNLPPMKQSGISLGDAQRLYLFNKWMIDTLAMGLDITYGSVPSNVYFFDYYDLMRVGTLYQPDSFCESDSHPNIAASEYASPYFVQESFNAAINYESSLPVELSVFNLVQVNDEISLYWRTETEVDNYGFEVEKCLSNKWQKIGFVQGHGNSNSPQEYFFIDNDLSGGSKFQYRLKQIDTDGDFEYSNIVETVISPTDYYLFQNYPNPFNPGTTIRYSLPESAQIKINVYNTLGEQVATIADGFYESGYYKITFNANNLPSGTYIYRLESDKFNEVKKMILLR